MSSPTLAWLQGLYRRGHRSLARSIAQRCAADVDVYSIEEYEAVLTHFEARALSVELTNLTPYWLTDSHGHRTQELTAVSFRCTPEEALAAGFLTADMLPQGLKRKVFEKWYRVQKDVCGIEAHIEVEDGQFSEGCPLCMFMPSVIRLPAAPPARGLRLVIDNTRRPS